MIAILAVSGSHISYTGSGSTRSAYSLSVAGQADSGHDSNDIVAHVLPQVSPCSDAHHSCGAYLAALY